MKLTYKITSHPDDRILKKEPLTEISVEVDLADFSTIVPTVQRLERSLYDSLGLNYAAKQKELKALELKQNDLHDEIAAQRSELAKYKRNVEKVKDLLKSLGLDSIMIEKLNDIPF